MSEHDRCMRKISYAIAAIAAFTLSMGIVLVFQAFGDVSSDIHEIKDGIRQINEGWWRAFLPGGAIIAGLISAIGVLWKTLLRHQRLMLDEAKAAAKEREDFRARLDSLIKNGEESQNQRRDAVEVIVRKLDDQVRVITELIEEKKKNETDSERSDQATVRPGVRKR